MTDQRLKDDLNRLIDHPPKAREPLPPAAGQAAIPGFGRAGVSTNRAATTTAGIASPLTEPDYAAREYHAEVVLTSSDGVFTIEVQPLAAIELVDALGTPVRIEYAAPPPPTPP